MNITLPKMIRFYRDQKLIMIFKSSETSFLVMSNCGRVTSISVPKRKSKHRVSSYTEKLNISLYAYHFTLVSSKIEWTLIMVPCSDVVAMHIQFEENTIAVSEDRWASICILAHITIVINIFQYNYMYEWISNHVKLYSHTDGL